MVLNGVPRAGKSSIAGILEARYCWVAMGVDSLNQSLSEELRPGIGLRPGGERPDLEPEVERLFLTLYSSARSQAELGQNVVLDVGHHDSFSRSLGILPKCAALVADVGAYLIGVRCLVGEISRRRAETGMVCTDEMLHRWEDAVHYPGIYDIEVDTSFLSAEECVGRILERVGMEPEAFRRLVGGAPC